MYDHVTRYLKLRIQNENSLNIIYTRQLWKKYEEQYKHMIYLEWVNHKLCVMPVISPYIVMLTLNFLNLLYIFTDLHGILNQYPIVSLC